MDNSEQRKIEEIAKGFLGINPPSPDKGEDISSLSRGQVALVSRIYLLGNKPVSPGEVAESLGVCKSRISNALLSLENKGYVERSHKEEDRRHVRIVLTPKGEEFARENYQKLCHGIARFRELFGAERMDMLLSEMNKAKKVLCDMKKEEEGE